MTVSKNHSLEGFLEYSLSKFNTSDFANGTRPFVEPGDEDVEICRYPDYREPPNSPNKYQYSISFWYILTARLAFVVIFEVLLHHYYIYQ